VVLWLFYLSSPVHDTVTKRENSCLQALLSLIKAGNEKGEASDNDTETQHLSWGVLVLVIQLIQIYIDAGKQAQAQKTLQVSNKLENLS
jgi:hypothetical protein